MKKVALVAIAAVSTALSGCVTAPLWPYGGKVEVAPGYGSAKPCDLECVRTRVSTRFEAYVDAKSQIADFKTGANLALFGIGSAAGINAVTKGSKEGLQTLALSAAGIVGLDSTLKADDQYETFSAGADALQCVWELDRKQDIALTALGLPNLAPTPGAPSTDGNKPNGTSINALQTATQALGPYAAFGQPTSASASAFFAAISAGRKVVEADVGRSVRQASDADLLTLATLHRSELDAAEDRIRDAIAFRMQAVNPARFDKRADELNDALNDISEAVSKRLLYSNKDLGGIYDALKSAMEKAAKPPQPAPGATSPGKSAGTPGAALQTNAAARLFVLSAEQANQDAAAVAGYATTYKTCLDMTAKKGSAAPPAGDSKGGTSGGKPAPGG